MTTGTSTGDDENAVQAVIQSFGRAVQLRDVEAMLSHAAPDLTTFDMVPPLCHEGTDAVRTVWTKTLAAFDAPLEYELQHLRVCVDGKVAFASCMSRFGGKRMAGGNSSMWTCMTLGLRRIGPDWKIVHQHVSVPFDMETGKALADLKP